MITEIRGGMNVKRFHTTNRAQEETVGHHSANVCAILLRLHPTCSRDLLVAALMHDVAEVYTGDVPAPFKWENAIAKQALDIGEDTYISKHDIPNPVLDANDETLLKVADMMDLILSSLEELGRGNMYAKQLVTNGSMYIADMELSEDLMMKCNVMVAEVKAQWQII